MSQPLEFTFLGDGRVKIVDSANGYESQAYNIFELQTPEGGEAVVFGDSEANSLQSYGGNKTFYE